MILAHLIKAFAELLHFIINAYIIIIIIRSVLSFMGNVPRNQLTYLIYRITDPVFRWVHRKLPFMIIGHIDISPLVVLLALYFLDNLLYPMLMDIAIQMAISGGGFRT